MNVHKLTVRGFYVQKTLCLYMNNLKDYVVRVETSHNVPCTYKIKSIGRYKRGHRWLRLILMSFAYKYALKTSLILTFNVRQFSRIWTFFLPFSSDKASKIISVCDGSYFRFRDIDMLVF